jgi:23S rRNA-/tRNA-specific pseudouridylate synthase
MLHAYSLELKHPINGKSLKFTAPMPGDMEKVIQELKD